MARRSLPPVLKLAEQLPTAEAALARYKAEPYALGELIQVEAGCDEQCPRCRLQCSIMVGIVEGARQDLATAIGMAAPTLSHGGRFFVATEGRV